MEPVPTTNGQHPAEKPLPSAESQGNSVEPLVSLAYLVDEARSTTGKKSAFGSILDRFRRWYEESITPSGLLRAKPDQSATALQMLLDLREDLVGKGWHKSDDRALAKVFRGVAPAVVGECFLLSSDRLQKKAWRKRLHRLAENKDLAEPAEQLGELIEQGRLKKSSRPDGELGLHCDEAGWSVLRSEWSAGGGVVALQTVGSQMRVECRVRGESLFAGHWETRLTVDEKPREPAGPWENVGWNSDESGQYVEYRLDYGDGLSLDRVVFLARPASLLFVIDALRGAHPAQYRLESALETTGWTDAGLLAEGRCLEASHATGLSLRAIPLAAAYSTREPSPAGLRIDGSRMLWWNQSAGQRMALPLVLAWDKRPLQKIRPWRALTVTNDGPVMTSSDAAGYRFIHQGKNIVVFRSLLGTRRMAFLGHQTFYETLIGEFTSEGLMKDWLSVDADPDTPWDYFGALSHRQHQHPHPHDHVQRDR
jgi:hypothetical protein